MACDCTSIKDCSFKQGTRWMLLTALPWENEMSCQTRYHNREDSDVDSKDGDENTNRDGLLKQGPNIWVLQLMRILSYLTQIKFALWLAFSMH
ncbi:unnamed protein product [Thlaspi arvense]|uniref:Uncharacterized protein n=1 Tax=Thlaspi arvense TaxID=13288 RepID=A0AAU9RPK2_THLAR|nr:unnamed protein product [Thlaspi arvense]